MEDGVWSPGPSSRHAAVCIQADRCTQADWRARRAEVADRALAYTHLTLGEVDRAAEACARAAALPDPRGETARLAGRIEAAR